MGQKDALTLSDIEEKFQQMPIDKVKLGGFDIDGVYRGKYISLDKFRSAAHGGMGFCDVIFGWDIADELYDNTDATGWHTGYPDTQASIDLQTFRELPWEPRTAAFILDFHAKDGTPLELSPRQLLKKVAARAADMGFSAKLAAEFEFFIFDETPHSLREKAFRELKTLTPGMFGYSWTRASMHSDLMHTFLDQLGRYDIEIEGLHTETGPGVYEAAIKYDDIVRAADKAALFKTAVKEICARFGYTASFMAKWNAALPGCGGHVHQSLWDAAGTRNLFHDANDPQGISQTLRWFIGGQVALMPEMLAVIAPTINSYKRFVEGTWAPTHSTWGFENRTTALRIIGGKDAAKSQRVEYRLTAADMNPYTAMAASLAAGLWGIEHKMEPPAAISGSGYGVDPAKYPPLPRTLAQATEALDRSARVREVLGNGFVNHFVQTRRWECRRFDRAVTDWELQRYFELI